MKCKAKRCEFESGHRGPCSYVRRNHVVTSVVTRNQCAECVKKDAQIAELTRERDAAVKRADEWAKVSVEIDKNHRKKAKRDRAEYMRERRAKEREKREAGFIGVPYG